ncbi:Alpha/Beta hydrolase protein [Lophiotrema nucula]|uniref:Alpha/Beta hydrolase protein n=1 Tax=Lophiotrema nucula TaxID=690887 RepID=A0A6A5ZTJ1_9PLEO|nr:Alpha/Beta hydrolase protein [Lophiotrema nucula]
MVLPTTIAALAVALLGSCVSGQAPPPTAIDPTFFPNLKASEKLTWVDCYGTFKCAKFRVNADVSGKNRRDKVELAIAKLPAVSGNKTGTLVYSTGGYSGSNTNGIIQDVANFAPLYPNYDVIGIDRRGTGYSTPPLKCFRNNEERNAWVASEPPLLGSTKNALSQHRERAKKFAKQCADFTGDAAKWLGTYPSAVDIHTVMKAIGEKKIHFHGISSGTHTAQSFAALYPEAVGKFVLDAVVRSDLEYTISDNQPDTIVDLELAIEAFFITCNAADAVCPFKGSSTTVQQLKTRFAAIDKKLKTTFVTSPGFKPFDWNAFHRFLSVVILDSGVFFPALADLLVDLEAGVAGNGTQFASAAVFSPPPPLPPLDSSPPFEQIQAGICNDALDISRSPQDFDKYLAAMLKTSPNVGGLFAITNLYCTEWKIKPVNRFPLSKFNKSCLSKITGKILYISNTADSLCPLDSAYHMRTKYFGTKSTIIIDHTAGHTSVFQGALSGLTGFPSLGVFDIIFRFFNLNQLPPNGSIYLPDLPAFIDRGAGYAGLLPNGFGGVNGVPAYPIPGKTA